MTREELVGRLGAAASVADVTAEPIEEPEPPVADLPRA
jgi:hypothetical protein